MYKYKLRENIYNSYIIWIQYLTCTLISTPMSPIKNSGTKYYVVYILCDYHTTHFIWLFLFEYHSWLMLLFSGLNITSQLLWEDLWQSVENNFLETKILVVVLQHMSLKVERNDSREEAALSHCANKLQILEMSWISFLRSWKILNVQCN